MAAAGTQRQSDPAVAERQRWMGVLARAPLALLEETWAALTGLPDYIFVRRPETGLCMIRGRAGGAGARFNLGETTITRAAVRLASGAVGFGYVAGRSARQAELAALFDALLQEPAHRETIERQLITPAEARERVRRQAIAARAAATKVEFFTMVRGENAK